MPPSSCSRFWSARSTSACASSVRPELLRIAARFCCAGPAMPLPFRCVTNASKRSALEPEEELLALEAAGVADELPVGTDHPVAGEDDRDRVLVHRAADRAGGPGMAGLRG